ncbi:hypothetical protein M758_12G025500 [Ceratodon purpureus]|uniref:Uncharacterized protein n=1 Tax=Ceratodon purpureus TaxID=3225 RepID=A0A8T0G315_CERPU|nr:hypothetical protein KC19_12G025500 [Ceratodon purpureus]KAG0597854.1 hypothetical protein M758_12G025500 [Ceratodon purpureus]
MRTQSSQTEPRDRFVAMAAQGGAVKLGDPMSRVRRTQDKSISLSPAEREGHYQRNPGELAIGNLVDLKTEFERVKKLLTTLPDQIAGLPKMNPCGVYANHNVRLAKIHVYGFDYDYTLAHYTPALQHIIYELARNHLVEEHRYPDSCMNFQYDPAFPIRGLYYDKKMGYLLKLDFFHSVQPGGCFFGRRRLDDDELEVCYPGKHVSSEHMRYLSPLMDLFCLSEVCLLADVIQHFVDQKLDFDCTYVYEDVQKSIEYIHRSGNLHREILSDPAKYLQKNPKVVEMLQTLKERGKNLFILTNSPFPFVDGGMRFLFQETGKADSWRDLFDVVIALSDKPNFYSSQRPFRAYHHKKDVLRFTKVDSFEPHGVYYHGCLSDFAECTKWKGSEVIYFGDHLFSDLKGPAKAGWRTAAVIRELEREISTQNQIQYRVEQANFNMLKEVLGKFHGRVAPITREENNILAELREMRSKSRLAMKAMFNVNFGSTFLTDTAKESAFAYNVQRYADIYTSRLENFLFISSDAWLYTPFDVKILPHHVKMLPADEEDQAHRIHGSLLRSPLNG